MDLLIAGGTLVTVDLQGTVVQADLAVVGNRIAGLGDRRTLEARFGPPDRVLDATGRLVIPGLVNAHTHLFQAGMRGLGDGLNLGDWHAGVMLRAYAVIEDEDAYWFSLVGAIENLRSGVTTVANVQAYPNDFAACALTARATGELGLRAQLGKSLYGRTGQGELTPAAPDHLAETRRVFEELHGSHGGRITFAVTPPRATRAPRDAIIATHRIAAAHGSGVHTHVAETPADAAAAEAELGMSEVAYFDAAGVVDARFQAVHCVAIRQEEAELLAARGATAVHCPVSNMYLGSGVADLGAFRSAGLTVALGTDGPASNNNQDMMAVMKATALLQRVTRLDASLGAPGEVLEMATRGGAAALGIEAGEISAGRLADLVVLDVSGPHHQPLHRPVSSIVHAAHPDDVESVIVDGKLVMERRRITTVDEGQAIREARRRSLDLAERAGLDAAGRWPWS